MRFLTLKTDKRTQKTVIAADVSTETRAKSVALTHAGSPCIKKDEGHFVGKQFETIVITKQDFTNAYNEL